MDPLARLCICAGTALVVCGLPYKMDVTHYSLPTHKVKKDKKIAVIADLHCRQYGREQKKIIDIIKKEAPDLIVIPGDLFDYGRDYEKSFALIKRLKEYPVYFSSGNHDVYLKDDIAALRARLESEGVHVLEDTGEVLKEGEDSIGLYGMSDHGRRPVKTSEEVSHAFQTDGLRILISHRPELTDFYGKVDCDMIISGHAHGGQWRIPGTHQGLYFPRLGLFPKYTEGVHDLHGRKLIISRGLASGNPMIPRLYNNPEIVIIDVKAI
jgi:predicted MPP superfamily phosphohydrolase